MANWSTIETTLATWVRNLTGLHVAWKGRPRSPSFSNTGWCELSISGEKTVGNDNIIIEEDTGTPDPGEELLVSQDGARSFVFGVQIRTFRQDVGHDARHFASLIRDRVCMPVTTGEVLAAADVAFAKIVGDIPVDFELDGRPMSIHQLDLLMLTTSLVFDAPMGYISEVHEASVEVPLGTVVQTIDIPV